MLYGLSTGADLKTLNCVVSEQANDYNGPCNLREASRGISFERESLFGVHVQRSCQHVRPSS